MFDAAHAYETTVVIDDPDAEPTPAIAIGRVKTAELTMQVQVDGAWHRRTPDLRETACGEPIHSEFAATRREVLTMEGGGLCETCHTPHEIRRAAENDAAAVEATAEEERKRAEKDAERSKRRWKTPSQGDR
jgi:hypothetical protein